MATTLLKEVFGVRQFLGDPLEQAPSVRQVVRELEAEYQYLMIDASNRGMSQHVGETVITTEADQRRYELGVEADQFYKILSVNTVPADAVITGDDSTKRVTVTSGDGREQNIEMVELERFNDDWSDLRAGRGQLFSSTHDAQMVAFYKTIQEGVGEVLTAEFRPTPTSAQRYMILYQITDWWDRLFSASTDGANDYSFRLPHSSQRMLIRARVAMNLLKAGVVKWALNDDYNVRRGTVVEAGLKDKIMRYTDAYERYLDTLEHGDVVYVELFGDRL